MQQSCSVAATAYTKTTASWAVGTGNGALDAGSIANTTWYTVFLIQKPTTGVVDVLFSLSATAPTLPSGYTLFRRIGAMKTDASAHWLAFVQFGDEFQWALPVAETPATLSAVQSTITLSGVPAGVKLWARMRAEIAETGNVVSVLVTSPDETSTAVLGSNGNVTGRQPVSSQYQPAGELMVRTNISAQIKAVSDTSATTLSIATFGWVDLRGKI